ncbi:MAG: ParB/RepB/Spo0J family partition protein [Oscillospiraceae bacterium]|nr:ParB/RepB/Spo0J family partition protein [Oscillospiraceae bacterium]
MAKQSGLGRGLDALFEDNTNESEGAVQTLRMSEIEPNKGQPRQSFDEAAIASLADSIHQHGLIQPIVVRETPTGYQIIAGERRWRACRMLGMNEIPVVIKNFNDSEAAQIALIENIQRQDLNPIEEAAAYKELMEKYEMTQEELSKAVGKSRSAIANSVRMLNMPDEIQNMLKKNELSAGQAKAIAAAETEEEMIEIARKAANGQMTVRAIEKELSKKAEEYAPPLQEERQKRQAETYLTEMEISLRETLGRRVKIKSSDGKKGTITIDFFDEDDLSDLAEKITR